MLLHHYFRRYWFHILYLGIIYHFLSYFSKKSRSKWGFGKIFSPKPIFFLYFCTGNQISWFLWWRMSLWRHRSQTLGMLVLILVRGDSTITIGTKISIIARGFILKIWEGGNHPPPFVSCVTKSVSVRRGLKLIYSLLYNKTPGKLSSTRKL